MRLLPRRSYPNVPSDTLAVLFSRHPSSFTEPTFSRYLKTWHYSVSRADGLPNETLPSTTGVTVAVLSAGCYPERMLPLAKHLCDCYATTGSAQALLAAYLAAATTSRLTRANLSLGATSDAETCVWEGSAIPSPRPTAGLAALLGSLGVEAVIVWAALISGRRVAVAQVRRGRPHSVGAHCTTRLYLAGWHVSTRGSP